MNDTRRYRGTSHMIVCCGRTGIESIGPDGLAIERDKNPTADVRHAGYGPAELPGLRVKLGNTVVPGPPSRSGALKIHPKRFLIWRKGHSMGAKSAVNRL